MPNTADGLREAWTIVERTWRSTFSHARQLPESLLHESVNGEWSLVEPNGICCLRPMSGSDGAYLDEPGAWHRLGMPPDLRTGQPDPSGVVSQWGIDVWATPSLDEVLDARDEYMDLMRDVVGDLTHMLGEASAHNPPWIPSATDIPMSRCVTVVIREEWEHHGFAVRDLAMLEKQV